MRGHTQWFFLDDWDFVAGRSLSSVHDLFRPHNEHWSTLPIVVYRVIWQFFGLRTYVPYQFAVLTLHLTAAVLLRRIMRRADVDPWIATAAACAFVFLGSGRQDIVWGFQIGFVGSLACGLGHLILADHDGPLTRRDAAGIGLGVMGLLSSGVAVTMTIVVGISVLIRRGWRAAAVHTVPLAIVYGAWFVAIGHEGYQRSNTSLSEFFSFVKTGFTNAFARFGDLWGVGVLIAGVLVIGLFVAWARRPSDQLRRQAAVPAAMLVGALIFLVIAAAGRGARGTEFARATRYVHLTVALVLPALAVAADAIAKQRRGLLPVMAGLLVIGIPGNIDAIVPHGREAVTLGNPHLMLAFPASPFATRVPRSVHPRPDQAPEVTIGWLLDGVRDGKIPRPAHVRRSDAATATLGLLLVQSRQALPPTQCRTVVRALSLHVAGGDAFVIRGDAVSAHLKFDDGTLSPGRDFVSFFGSTLRVQAGPVTVVFTSRTKNRIEICRGG